MMQTSQCLEVISKQHIKFFLQMIYCSFAVILQICPTCIYTLHIVWDFLKNIREICSFFILNSPKVKYFTVHG